MSNQLENLFINTLELLNKYVSRFDKPNTIVSLKAVFKMVNSRLALVYNSFFLHVDLYSIGDRRFSHNKENYKQIYDKYFKDNENQIYKFFYQANESMPQNKLLLYHNKYDWIKPFKLEDGLNQINKSIRIALLRDL